MFDRLLERFKSQPPQGTVIVRTDEGSLAVTEILNNDGVVSTIFYGDGSCAFNKKDGKRRVAKLGLNYEEDELARPDQVFVIYKAED